MFAAHHKLDNLTAVEELEKVGVSCDLIDLRSTSPLDTNEIIKSVKKTGRLLAIDSSSVSFSVASEIVARAATEISEDFKCAPSRLALEDLASPSSFGLTKKYYFGSKEIAQKVLEILDLKTKISENVFLKEHPHDVPGDWFKGPF